MAPQPHFTTVVELPFDGVLREVHGRLMTAHAAAVGTLEAELSRMRNENTALRMKLVEAGVSTEPHGPAVSAPTKPTKYEESVESMPPPLPLPINTSLRAPAFSSSHAVADAISKASDTKTVSANTVQQIQPVVTTGTSLAPQVLEPVSSITLEKDVLDPVLSQVPEELKKLDDGKTPVRGTETRRVVSGTGSPNIPDEGPRNATVLTVAPATVTDTMSSRSYLKKEGSAAAMTAALLTPTAVGSPVVLGSSSALEVTGKAAEGPVQSGHQRESLGGVAVHTTPIATTVEGPPITGRGSPQAVPQIAVPPTLMERLDGVGTGRPSQPNHRSDVLEESIVPSTQLEQISGSELPENTTTNVDKAEEEPEIIEVITPGAANAMERTQDIDRALEAVMAYYGWQHLEVERVGEDQYSIAGSELVLRCDGVAEQPGEPPYRLSASSDGGTSWESLGLAVRNRRLHKVVRTAPIPATREIHPNAQEGLDYDRELQPAQQAPISLADLARMPSRTPSTQGNSPHGGASEVYNASSYGGGIAGYGGTRIGSSPNGSSPFPGANTMNGQPFRSKSSYEGGIALGPDGLPTHLQNGLPSFNNAFPTYFDALSGASHYYQQFRIPDRQSR